MNLLDHFVTKVISPARQRVDEEYCCWEAEVEYDCWGKKGRKIWRETTRQVIEKRVEIGYTWKG